MRVEPGSLLSEMRRPQGTGYCRVPLSGGAEAADSQGSVDGQDNALTPGGAPRRTPYDGGGAQAGCRGGGWWWHARRPQPTQVAQARGSSTLPTPVGHTVGGSPGPGPAADDRSGSPATCGLWAAATAGGPGQGAEGHLGGPRTSSLGSCPSSFLSKVVTNQKKAKPWVKGCQPPTHGAQAHPWGPTRLQNTGLRVSEAQAGRVLILTQSD